MKPEDLAKQTVGATLVYRGRPAVLAEKYDGNSTLAKISVGGNLQSVYARMLAFTARKKKVPEGTPLLDQLDCGQAPINKMLDELRNRRAELVQQIVLKVGREWDELRRVNAMLAAGSNGGALSEPSTTMETDWTFTLQSPVAVRPTQPPMPKPAPELVKPNRRLFRGMEAGPAAWQVLTSKPRGTQMKIEKLARAIIKQGYNGCRKRSASDKQKLDRAAGAITAAFRKILSNHPTSGLVAVKRGVYMLTSSAPVEFPSTPRKNAACASNALPG